MMQFCNFMTVLLYETILTFLDRYLISIRCKAINTVNHRRSDDCYFIKQSNVNSISKSKLDGSLDCNILLVSLYIQIYEYIIVSINVRVINTVIKLNSEGDKFVFVFSENMVWTDNE